MRDVVHSFVLEARTRVADGPPPGLVVAFYAAFIAVAGFGYWLAIIPGMSITFWPPNGLYIAVLMLSPVRLWPWWIATAVAAELTCNLFWFRNSGLGALGFTAANAIESAVAALLLRPFFPDPVRLRTLKQVIALLVLGVGVAPAVGAIFGAMVHVGIGKYDFPTAFKFWLIGDATGVLVALPLCLVLFEAWREPRRPTSGEVTEAALVLVFLVAVSLITMSGRLPFAYIMVPPILWAAIQFEFYGAAAAMFLVTLLVGVATALGFSKFVGPAPAQASLHVLMQLLLAVSAVTALVVAAIAAEQRRAREELELMNRDLEHRVAERSAALVAGETRFRATVENAAVGMAMLRPDGRFIMTNQRLATILGYERAELMAKTWQKLTHPDDVATDAAQRDRLSRGEADSFQIEKRYVRKDGTVIWAELHVGCIRDKSGAVDYFVSSMDDITQRKQSEDQIRLLLREVNHRSKNLLALVQAVARQTAAASPADFLERFQQRLGAMSDAQDLLVRNEWKGVEIEPLARSQLAHFADLVDTRVTIGGPTIMVSAPAAQAIALALHELATNAAKYGALSNGSGRVDVRWAIEPGDGRPQFIMSWTEKGGPPVDQPTRRGFGTSVLEDLTRMALEAHVQLDFDPDGLTWNVKTALADVVAGGAAALAEPAEAQPAPAVAPARRSLLVVEDEPLIALDIARMLREAGFDVIGPAASVSQAFALLDRHACHGAVLDINLGGETAEPIARRLAAAGTPFVAVSGYARDQRPPAFEAMPALDKPVQSEALVTALRQVLHAAR
ncbi:MAG: MASE1 domain-containing protein [Hyphomicrobiales bacterium]|nr:MASE1 domain-containing protein [Hyphomicrobiales bacterium]